jgi:iron complex outermembrane receptor protein
MRRGARARSMLAALLWTSALAGPTWAQTTPAAKPAAPTPKPPPANEDEDDAVPTVVVTGHKLPPQPGAVVGDIKPELQLAPSDIQSYGVSTVTELLEELAPETRSDRGRGGETPVVLLNGRRISSFNEIQNIPTEAILRVDILPEEVSLKYGYTADQRVVNIVLRRRFRAITGEAVGGDTTEGGHETGQGEVDLLHLRGDSRLNLDLKYQVADQLTEVQRDLNSNTAGAPFSLIGNITSPTANGEIDPALSALVGQPVTVAGVPASAANRIPSLSDFAPTAGVPNVTPVGGERTLLPATQQVTANGVFSTPTIWGLTATINGTLGATASRALQGLSGLSLLIPEGDPFSPFGGPVQLDRYADGTPLRQSIDGWTAHLGSTLNRDLGDWRFSLTNAYDHADTQTVSDVGVNPAPIQALLNAAAPGFNPYAPLPGDLLLQLPQNSARSITDAANIQFLANGPLLKVPAGSLYVSAKVGDTESLLDSHSTGLQGFQGVSLSRNDANAQLNLDLPLASVSHHVLPWLGELSVNVNSAVDQLSDFGLLKTFGYGVNWTPVTGVNLIVSHTNDHAAPTTLQLGGAVVTTPGVRLFDYATGQTVELTQITGGADKLTADNRNVLKVGLTLKPFASENLTITANYIQVRLDNPIETFPAASAAIEAAFPDRFIRDAEGDLIEEDDRPVNFARQDRQELRWGFNYSRPIGPQPPPRRFNPAAFRRPGQAPRRRPDGSPVHGPPGDTGSSGADPGSLPPVPTQTTDGDGGGHASSQGAPGGGGRGRGFGGGRGGGFGGGPAAGRLQFAVYHTIFFQDQFLVRQGGPVLDLLNGAAAGNTGGQPRQEIEAQLGFTLLGFGARLSADWKSGTMVKGGAGAPADNLTFSDIGTINLRLFDNLGQQRSVVHAYPWLRGSRITLSITNLFDQRIDVRDGTGATPLNYQSAYLDPAGRTITLSLRKLFY